MKRYLFPIIMFFPNVVFAEQIFPIKIHNQTNSLIRENSKRENLYVWNSFEPVPNKTFVLRKINFKQEFDETKFLLTFSISNNFNFYLKTEDSEMIYVKTNVNLKF